MASAGASNDRDEGLARHLAVPQIIHGLQASRRSLEALLDDDGRRTDSREEADLQRELHHERMGTPSVGET